MKRYIRNLLLLVAGAVVATSCQKDPLDDITEGGWNRERNIIGISFKGQIGKAEIVRTGDDATIKFICNTSDMSSVELADMELSVGAKASVNIGDKLNFDNPENIAVINVTAATGAVLEWKVKAEKFVNPYEGTWSIQRFFFKYDDWNGWGLAGENFVSAAIPNAAKSDDDIITFGAVEGVDATGAIYGAYERTAGANGEFGSYVSREGKDWAFKFGQLPAGKGKYFINPDNTISVEIDGTNKKYTSKGITESTASSIKFELKADQIWEINWDDYYCAENQIRMAYQVWYDLNLVTL